MTSPKKRRVGTTSRAVIYTRLSDLGRDKNETDGLQRQLDDCTAWAKRRGINISLHLSDAGKSAYQRGTRRTDFERLLLLMESAAVEYVLVWRLDRLARRSDDLERVIRAAEDSGITIVETQPGREHNAASGYVVPRIVSAIAGEESRSIGVRMARHKYGRATKGKHNGGGHRPLGWTTTRRDREIPSEKKLVLELVSRFLDGETCHSIAVDWNNRKLKSTLGKGWSSPQLYSVLRNHSYAGRIVYGGKADTSEQGTTFKASWKAFYPDATYDAIWNELAQRAEQPKNGGFHGRKHLLSGILVCGKCGYKVLAWKGNDTRPAVYFCQKRTEHPETCGKTRVNMRAMDRVAIALTLRALRDPEVLREISSGRKSSDIAAMQRQLKDLRGKMVRLETDMLTGKQARNQAYRNAMSEMGQQAEVLARDISGVTTKSAAGTGLKTEKDWLRLTLIEQRQILSGLYSAILLNPGRSGEDPLKRVTPLYAFQEHRFPSVDGRLLFSSSSSAQKPPSERSKGARRR
jgi:site-specific DNA recombinase